MSLTTCLGRAVGRGLISPELAKSVLVLEYPNADPTTLAWNVQDVARETDLAIGKAAQFVRQAAFPLCRERRSGREILAAAQNVSSPLREWEVVDLCREIAQQTIRRRFGGRR